MARNSKTEKTRFFPSEAKPTDLKGKKPRVFEPKPSVTLEDGESFTGIFARANSGTMANKFGTVAQGNQTMDMMVYHFEDVNTRAPFVFISAAVMLNKQMEELIESSGGIAALAGKEIQIERLETGQNGKGQQLGQYRVTLFE